MTKHVISLYDYTTVSVQPWAEAGYECWCYDIQHLEHETVQVGKGKIHKVNADLNDKGTIFALYDAFKGADLGVELARYLFYIQEAGKTVFIYQTK